MLAILFALALLTPVADQELDRLHLKDGRTLTGYIVSETDTSYVFEILLKGSKGQTAGVAKTTVPKSNVERVERMSDEARAKARARLGEFRGRKRTVADALARVRIGKGKIGTVSTQRTAGPNFEILATCNESLLRQATVYVEEIFAGYRQHFEIKHNVNRKIKIYLFADSEEYGSFQTALFGAAVENVAFYVPKANVIVAYDMIEKEKAKQIAGEIRNYNKEIKDFKKKIRKRDHELSKEYREARESVAREAALIREKIRVSGAANKKEMRRQLAQEERKLYDDLKKQKKKLDKQLDDYRKQCNAAIKENKKCISRNRKILAQQNNEMFETLFHEGFHAFVANYLYPSKSNIEIPRWLNEGMAMYFEKSAVELSELLHGGIHKDELKLLREKIKGKAHVPLRGLVLAGGERFLVLHKKQQDHSSLLYAESWALVHYLIQHLSREKFESYVTEVLAGAPKDSALEKVLGRSLESLEPDWIDYVQKLR